MFDAKERVQEEKTRDWEDDVRRGGRVGSCGVPEQMLPSNRCAHTREARSWTIPTDTIMQHVTPGDCGRATVWWGSIQKKNQDLYAHTLALLASSRAHIAHTSSRPHTEVTVFYTDKTTDSLLVISPPSASEEVLSSVVPPEGDIYIIILIIL